VFGLWASVFGVFWILDFAFCFCVLGFSGFCVFGVFVFRTLRYVRCRIWVCFCYLVIIWTKLFVALFYVGGWFWVCLYSVILVFFVGLVVLCTLMFEFCRPICFVMCVLFWVFGLDMVQFCGFAVLLNFACLVCRYCGTCGFWWCFLYSVRWCLGLIIVFTGISLLGWL